MDIEPTPMGAVVDVTETAVDAVLEMLAEALHRKPFYADQLLFALRDAVETRSMWLEREAAGRAISRETMDAVSADVDAVRDALGGLLAGRVLVSLGAAGCLQRGGELVAAGEQARTRFRTPGQPAQLPAQRNRRNAA